MIGRVEALRQLAGCNPEDTCMQIHVLWHVAPQVVKLRDQKVVAAGEAEVELETVGRPIVTGSNRRWLSAAEQR